MKQLTSVANKIIRKVNTTKIVRILSKNKVEILLFGGTAGLVGSGILLCRSTLKAKDIYDESTEKLIEFAEHSENLPDDEYKKELIKSKVETGLNIAECYILPVSVGVLSLGMIFSSNKVLKKRMYGIAESCLTIETAYKNYRKRVVERYGEKADKELLLDRCEVEVEETVTTKSGKEKKVKKVKQVFDPESYSGFARCWGKGCNGWSEDSFSRIAFLKLTQAEFNKKLKTIGYVFINEIYEYLGLPKCEAGQVAGWIYEKDNLDGDNYIDFGIWDLTDEDAMEFFNGKRASIILDFNVDGNILERVTMNGGWNFRGSGDIQQDLLEGVFNYD